MESFMNTKISKVISETVFDPSVKEHRNQLTVFFDDGESIKYDFYNEKLLKDATRNINYLRLFRDEFVFDCKEKVNFLHLFYTSYVQAYSQFRKNNLCNIRKRLFNSDIDIYQKVYLLPSELLGHIKCGFEYSVVGNKDGYKYTKDDAFICLDYLNNEIESIEERIIRSFEKTFNELLDGVEKGNLNHDVKSENA